MQSESEPEEWGARVPGKVILEGQGKVVGMKRLASGKIEETFDMNGLLLGEKFSGTYTIEGKVRPDGTGFVETRGFISTRDGYPIQLTGIANGRTEPNGITVLRGANCYSCPTGKFAKLNEIVVMWKAEVDEGGNIKSVGWEWK